MSKTIMRTRTREYLPRTAEPSAHNESDISLVNNTFSFCVNDPNNVSAIIEEKSPKRATVSFVDDCKSTLNTNQRSKTESVKQIARYESEPDIPDYFHEKVLEEKPVNIFSEPSSKSKWGPIEKIRRQINGGANQSIIKGVISNWKSTKTVGSKGRRIENHPNTQIETENPPSLAATDDNISDRNKKFSKQISQVSTQMKSMIDLRDIEEFEVAEEGGVSPAVPKDLNLEFGVALRNYLDKNNRKQSAWTDANNSNVTSHSPAMTVADLSQKPGFITLESMKPDDLKIKTPVGAIKPTTATTKIISIKWLMIAIAKLLAFLIGSYIVLPLGLILLVNSQDGLYLKVYLHLGFLGLIQGVLCCFIIYYIVDLPIQTNINQLDKETRDLINPKKYLLINYFTVFYLIVCFTGAEMGLGMAIITLGWTIDTTRAFLALLGQIIIQSVLWIAIILCQYKGRHQSKKCALNKDIQQIERIRKDFINELNEVRIQTELKDHEPPKNSEQGNKPSPGLKFFKGLGSPKKMDLTRLHTNLPEYLRALTNMRLNIVKAFLACVVIVAHLLALVEIQRILFYDQRYFLVIGLMITSAAIGFFFGIFNFFMECEDTVFPTSKMLNRIINGGAYRLFFFVVGIREAMIAAVLIKFLYKIIAYYVFLYSQTRLSHTGQNRIIKALTYVEVPVLSYVSSDKDKEAALVKPFDYIVQKVSIAQEVDSFFAISTLFALLFCKYWFLVESSFKIHVRFMIKYNDLMFYVALVSSEIGADLLLWIHFIFLSRRLYARKANILRMNTDLKVSGIFHNRKLLVGACKMMVLFIFFFFSAYDE